MYTVLIQAAGLTEGMYLGPKTRVAMRHPRTDIVWVKTTSRGARSPSVAAFENDDMVRIWVKD